MKKVLIYVGIAALFILTVFLAAERIGKAEAKWKTAMANVKAYSDELGISNKKNTALQLTVDQLVYFNDSVLQELDEARKELKIKDKNLKALQQVTSSFTRTDTIVFTQTDTLFREPSLAIDTILGDEWYNLELGLRYPSMIAVKPEFKSKKNIIVSSKKETVNPPKKFFLLRLFQKKQRVLHIDVIEKNPYVSNEHSKYVEIIK